MATAGLAASDRIEPGADEGEDGADEHVIDGEPPVGDTAAVGARQPHAAPRFIAMPGSAATSVRKASPRTSKLRN